jgi:hypothetical protein
MTKQFALSLVAEAVAEQCGTTLASAVNAENTARDRWAKAGKSLYKAGARVEALTKGTKDEPNPAQDDSLIATIERMITEALSASVKPMKFTNGTYTVGELVGMSREALRDADDKVLSQTRKYWQQQVGSIFGLVRRYVDRVQNPDKVRTKKGRAEEKPVESTDPVVILQGFAANKTKLVDVANVDKFENALMECIALIRAHRKA